MDGSLLTRLRITEQIYYARTADRAKPLSNKVSQGKTTGFLESAYRSTTNSTSTRRKHIEILTCPIHQMFLLAVFGFGIRWHCNLVDRF